MASVWIEKRRVSDGSTRFRVRYRLGGSESIPKYAGSFKTKRDAQRRSAWVMGELAAMSVPDLGALAAAAPSPTLAIVAEQWRDSRVDVAKGTATTHKVNLTRIIPTLGTRPVDRIELSDVAAFVTELHTGGLKRESIRKTLATLAMILDFADAPIVGKDTRGHPVNAARDRTTVRLPREDRAELAPPTAEHVLAVHGALARQYRLPLLVLDATGMRIGELEALTWGDVDEPRGRWRVSQTVAKTGRARWVKAAGIVRCSHRTRATRGPNRRPPRVPGRDRRPATHRDWAGLHRGGRSGVLAARPPAPPNLAPPPPGRRVGHHRRGCRSAEPLRHREHLHARADRRGRGRLRNTQPLPMMPSLCQKWSQLVGPVVVPSDSTTADFGPPPATTSA